MNTVTIRAESCKSCGFCVKYCPKKVLSIGTHVNSKGYQYAEASALENCVACGMCAQICPDAAIEVYKEENA